ncbi:50S ribosomal protein L11 methyltransferase [Cellulosilyticum lentocellum]|uniref:Ribosomal protein L11 methyltransferase n=1 Tax=Cellulosilyticum lentocellum (strain ATCC 49066 / DSM 5427 / NCIMB 11756 / RHM5) TaxID=642492 RepID=F2JQY8_CELLD|nr:50S ribosomal protein L11 methyltransferase [Cellulosilyticum lentocellum]ADZ83846.1 ribosomal protein L11 methyltransferase [Cellulosilyticum lentocellum DSM 5427]
MNWLEVTIDTSKQGLETITGILLQLGVTGFVIQDPDDFDEFLTYQGKTWDYMDEDVEKLKDCPTNIKFYLAENMQGQETFKEIKKTLERMKDSSEGADYGSLEMSLGNVNEEDWANNWKKYFKPFEVGEKFVIKPTWESYNENTNRMILEIDPNSSFGTGQHYTTQLCIEQLEQIIKPDAKVLDMGCGSGILSIATLLLGAQHVTAVDIDQNSVDIAKDNFIQNGMKQGQFALHCGNVIADEALVKIIGQGCYDVVVANIVADVIIGMKELLKDFLKPGGTLIASGIIGDRSEEVKEHLKSVGFTVKHMTEKNDWVAIMADF